MKSKFLSQFLIALVASAVVLFGYTYFNGSRKNVIIEHVDNVPSQQTLFTIDEKGNPTPLDFTGAAEKSVSAVVHIIAASGINQKSEIQTDMFGRQFRIGKQPSVGSGSGVILSEDGYIVTNNHVIKEADDLEVTLNDKRKFKAKLIGTDPTTDIAVIKIDAKNLSALKFSNSDLVKVGNWVLAVGNPFNLTSTVTAGIVSAKGRDIALMDRGSIESFIQTDAAINPGNSGGALVDLNGNLIGINTAIASETGTYSGYGFAVPANLASRVVSDLIKYGSTQRGYLGVSVVNLEYAGAKALDLPLTEGAFIASVSPKGAAHKAGIEANDVVIAINGQKVKGRSDMIELVASHRIGDDVKVKVYRKGSEKEFIVKLQNETATKNSIGSVPNKEDFASKLGADLITLDKNAAREYSLENGVLVTNINSSGILASHNIEEGFIITEIDKTIITSADQVIDLLRKNTEGVFLKGFYPGDSRKYRYGISPQ